MSSIRTPLPCLSSSSPSFDRILGGGFSGRSVNMIAGEPGAGKTLFALQMMFHLARQGKKGLYFTTLSEPSPKLLTYMQQFSFFDEQAIDREIIFSDLGSVIRTKGAEAALEAVTSRVERVQPAIVVIDSFKAVRDLLGSSVAVRTFIYDLAVHTSGWGATSLFVGEYTDDEIANFSEFAIADGIIRLSNRPHDLIAVRELEVLKLRGADYITGRHFFEINRDGLAFFPRVRGPDATEDEPASPTDRCLFGIEGLDAMFGGGVPRASSTILLGGTGTGKTLLGLHFLLEGAKRGEPGILFTLEETVGQLRWIAQGFGWDLASLEASGMLTLRYTSPVELSTDSFLDRARQEVEKRGARRAVLDSLTSMSLSVSSQQRFKELVYAMTKHFRARGVTLNLNMEIVDLLGSAQLSGSGVSFAADNLVHLKYVEVDGRLERGISVMKARGVRHSTEVRRMNVQPNGVHVGGAFTGFRGVLTGLPIPTKAEEK
jgi:circadian clock protein KaiC